MNDNIFFPPQLGCGACWAFTVAASIEGQLFKKTGKMIPLSVQNLIDCSRSYGTNGCQGGKVYSAFQYVKNIGGLEAEATYPYEAKVSEFTGWSFRFHWGKQKMAEIILCFQRSH